MKKLLWFTVWLGLGIMASEAQEVTEHKAAVSQPPAPAIARHRGGIWRTNDNGAWIYVYGNFVRVGGPIAEFAGKKPFWHAFNPLAPVNVKGKPYWDDLATDPHTGNRKGFALLWVSF